jgi:glycerol kinase
MISFFKWITAGIDVIRPKMVETTSLGAAIAAAKTVNLWSRNNDDMSGTNTTFKPIMTAEVRDSKLKRWGEAIERSLGWQKN